MNYQASTRTNWPQKIKEEKSATDRKKTDISWDFVCDNKNAYFQRWEFYPSRAVEEIVFFILASNKPQKGREVEFQVAVLAKAKGVNTKPAPDESWL